MSASATDPDVKEDMPSDNTTSIGEQVVGSTLWLGSWRWSARLIGLGTTVILARLLVPEDFGILATGAIIVGFFAILSGLGVDNYLIRLEDPQRVDYDTAWTLRLIVTTAVAAAIFLAAEPGAAYFEDPRIEAVLQVLAVASWLGAWANIGLTMYRREMQFRIIALIGISQRITASATTIALAFWLRNYWAMVIGEIVFMLVGLILSYTHHEFRPRFALATFRKQWDFCKWIVVQNVASFLSTQGNSFVIVKFFGIDMMGLFSMAGRIAVLPSRQILAPMLPPIYSGLAKKQHDAGAFVNSVLKVIGATSMILLPGATLVACLAEPLVVTILGERWLPAIPLLAPLTLAIAVVVMAQPVGSVLTVKGRVRLIAAMNWFTALAGLAVFLVAAQWLEIETLLWIQVGVALVFLVMYYAILLAACKIPVLELIGCLYRPILASAVMAVTIYWLSSKLQSEWAQLLVGAGIGGTTCLVVAFALWRMAGSPDSGEALLHRNLGKIIRRKMKK